MTTTIDAIWAFLVLEDGHERLCSFRPRGEKEWTIMVAYDEGQVARLREPARSLSALTKKDVRLVRFTTREVLETIKGGN